MPYGTELIAPAARGGAALARGLLGARSLQVGGGLALGVGVTSYAVGKGVSSAGSGLFKAGAGLGIAYLVYRALKR